MSKLQMAGEGRRARGKSRRAAAKAPELGGEER